jgi:hypothetical protein
MELARLKVDNIERADDRLSVHGIARVDRSSRQLGRRCLCRSMIRSKSNRRRNAADGCEHEIATIETRLICYGEILRMIRRPHSFSTTLQMRPAVEPWLLCTPPLGPHAAFSMPPLRKPPSPEFGCREFNEGTKLWGESAIRRK